MRATHSACRCSPSGAGCSYLLVCAQNLPPDLLDELMHQHMYATDTLGSEFDMCDVCGEHFYHDEYDSPRVASQACAQHRSAELMAIAAF